MDYYAIGTCQNIMIADSGTLRPITYYIESPDDILKNYDKVAYDKGIFCNFFAKLM